MKKLFIILMLCLSINCIAQRSLELTFAPGANSVGLQFNHVVFEKFDYQLAADYNFKDYYRSSIGVGHTVLYDYFFVNVGVAYSTFDNKEHRFTPEITIYDREIDISISISVDLKLGYARVGIGFKF